MLATQDYLLRTAEPRDFAAMCELLSQLTVIDGPCGPPTRGDWERMLAGAAAREQSIVVAEDTHSGALLGTASLIVEHKLIRGCGRVGHVEDVVTHEKARGCGVGRALLGRLAELAREAGCYKVILDCADKNAAFYEKSGYRRAELQMRLDLGPPQRGARPPAPAPSNLRVLSLLSASTEIVCRLGCAHLLVGRSHGCDDPPLATALPVVTAPRVDPNAPSLQLDEAVRAQAAAGGPIYQIRSALVRSLRPDVIITQEQCRICAVTPEDVDAACVALPSTALVSIMPVTLDDVLGDVVTIAAALGAPERGRRLVAHMRARLGAIAPLVPAGAPAPRAHLEWLAPLMGSGYWIAECVQAAGCSMVHGTKGGHSRVIERASMLADADLILLAPCGFSLERTRAELSSLPLLQSDEWRALPAVRSGAVAVADGNLYFNRSSCGVVEAAEIVAEAAHPELRGLFGHHGRHWVSLSELDAFCARDGAASPTKPTKPVALASGVVAAAVESGGGAAKLRDTGAATPSAHVDAQLKALCDGDFASAFALNSAANRARLSGAANFEAIVKGSPSFSVLLHSSTVCVVQCDDGEGSAAAAAVRVQATAAADIAAAANIADEVRFVFDLSRSGAGTWETDGVRIEC